MKKIVILLSILTLFFCFSCDFSQGKPGEKNDHGHSHGHNHGTSQNQALSEEELGQKKCEHGILQIECDACRFELGLVRLDPAVEKQFIKAQRVTATAMTVLVDFVGEVGVNQLKTVIVSPIVSGRVIKVVKKLGDEVKNGDLLAVLQSQEYGKAKMEYLTACHQYNLAQKNYQWAKMTHENLRNLVDALQKGGKSGDLTKLIVGVKIGKYKEKLIESASRYRVTLARYEREKKIVRDMRRLLEIVRQEKENPSSSQELKNLKIGEWKGKIFGALSRLEVTQKNYEREKSLIRSNASSQRELNVAEGDYRTAQSEFQGILEEFSVWVEQKEDDLQADLESALARYLTTVEEVEMDIDLHFLEIEKEYQASSLQKASAEKMLSLLGLGAKEIENLHALDQNSNYSLGTFEVRSPIDGTIISFNISEGQFVEASKELYTVSDLETLWVWCDVYEQDWEILSRFQKGLSHLQASVGWEESIQGVPVTLDYLSEKIEEKTRTLKMRAILENREKRYKPGLYVKLHVRLPSLQKSITVDENAILTDENQPFLFKKWKDHFWMRSDLKLGARFSKQVEVLEGLSEGDSVVVRGGFILKSEILKAKMGAG